MALIVKNSDVSTITLSSYVPERLLDGLKAFDVVPKLTVEVLERIESILGSSVTHQALV